MAEKHVHCSRFVCSSHLLLLLFSIQTLYFFSSTFFFLSVFFIQMFDDFSSGRLILLTARIRPILVVDIVVIGQNARTLTITVIVDETIKWRRNGRTRFVKCKMGNYRVFSRKSSVIYKRRFRLLTGVELRLDEIKIRQKRKKKNQAGATENRSRKIAFLCKFSFSLFKFRSLVVSSIFGEFIYKTFFLVYFRCS